MKNGHLVGVGLKALPTGGENIIRTVQGIRHEQEEFFPGLVDAVKTGLSLAGDAREGLTGLDRGRSERYESD